MKSEENGGQALAARATALANVGRNKEALPLIMKAIVLEPDNPDILGAAARININCGNSDEGMRLAEKAVVAQPDWYYPHVLRCHVLLSRSRIDEALEAAKTAAANGPRLPQALKCLIEVKMRQNDTSECIALANRIIELAPDNPESFITLAEVAQRLKQWDRATWAANQALALDPACVEARLIVGKRLERDGLDTQALGWYLEAAQIEPGKNEAKYAIESASTAFTFWPILIGGILATILWFLLHLAFGLSGLSSFIISLITQWVLLGLLQAKAPLVLLALQPKFRSLPLKSKQQVTYLWRSQWWECLASYAGGLFVSTTVSLILATVFYSAYTYKPVSPLEPGTHRKPGPQELKERAIIESDRRREDAIRQVYVKDYGEYVVRKIDPQTGNPIEPPNSSKGDRDP